MGDGEAGALGRWIVTLFAAQHCNAFCGASIVAHFARKVRGGEGCGDSFAPERGSYLG